MTNYNESISQIVDELVTAQPPDDSGVFTVDPDQLKEALTAREDTLLDGLRLEAANQGLMPATVQLALISSGFGSPQDDATVQHITAVSMVERQQLMEFQAELRRRLGEGSG